MYVKNQHALPAIVLLGPRGESLPRERVLAGGAGAVVPWGLPAGGRGAVVDVFSASLPSLGAGEEDRSLSLTEEGGAVIGSTVNLSLIRRYAKLKGPGVIPQVSAY